MLLGLIVLPVGVLVLGSFLSAPPRALHIDWGGLTLDNYAAVLNAEGFGAVLARRRSAPLSPAPRARRSSAPRLAWLAVRSDVPARRRAGRGRRHAPVRAARWSAPSPGTSSPRPAAASSTSSLRALGAPVTLNIYSVSGVAFAYAIYYAPYVYLFVGRGAAQHGRHARGSGVHVRRWPAARAAQITLPLILPALLSSSLLVFVLLVELFAIPAVLGEPGNLHFLAVRIWDLIGFTPPEVNQASALGVADAAADDGARAAPALGGGQAQLCHRRAARASASGPSRSAGCAGSWRRSALLYLALVVVLPFAALLFIALRRNIFFFSLAALLDTSQLSLRPVRHRLRRPGGRHHAAELTRCLALAPWRSARALYFAVSYIVHRTRWPGRRALDIVTVLPVAIPGIIVGLGYLWSWISLPVGLYGTLWILILAYVSQFAPQATRAIAGSLVQIHPELEESSRLSGAGLLTTLRLVVIPLARPGIISAALLLFVLSFRELATALFLYTSGTQLFSLAMFDFWQRGSTGLVAAMAVVQIAILLVLVLVAQRLRRADWS